MADPLAERVSQTLFGTTTRTDVEMLEFTKLMPRPKQTQPCEGESLVRSTKTNIWITTNACGYEHKVRLIKLPDHTDAGLGCTYTPVCTVNLYTTFECKDFPIPDEEGTYVFQIEVDGTITMGAVIKVVTAVIVPAPPGPIAKVKPKAKPRK